jgi:tetratricopeptide (TPR) repeat protein
MTETSFELLCQKAKEALGHKEWDKARQLLQKALAIKSDSPDVHYNLATACFQLDDLTGAASHFKQVTRLDPLRAGAYINLGAVYNLLDQLDDAIATLRRGLELDSHRCEGYYNLGLVYRRKGQKDLAIQAYREAIRVNPRMGDAYYNVGNLHMEKQQFAQAVTAYKQALQLHPNWERATKGLQQAEQALATSGQSLRPSAQGIVSQKPSPPEPPKSRTRLQSVDAERLVDPNAHGVLLSNLHQATIDSETHGRSLLKLLETEVEPSIKELSTLLLYSNTSAPDLDDSVKRFETAMTRMQGLQQQLQIAIEKIRHISERFLDNTVEASSKE